MILGHGLALPFHHRFGGVVAAGLTHDWKMDERLLGPLVDRVGGYNLTCEMGQALDYVPSDYSLETSGNLMDFIHGKTSATVGALVWLDSTAAKAVGPGGYIGTPLGLITSSNPYLRVVTANEGALDAILVSSGVTTGAWFSIVIQVNLTTGTARGWVNGVEKSMTFSGARAEDTIYLEATNAMERKLVLGATSSNPGSMVAINAFDGKISRFFVTSDLVSIADAEAILRGDPGALPTLTDGHIFILDTEGATSQCRRSAATVTHTAAALNTNWTNGSRQTIPHPQKALGRGAYAGAKGIGFQTTGANTRSAAAYGTVASPTGVPVFNNGDMTFSAWVKRSGNTNSNQQTILQFRDEVTTDGLRILCPTGAVGSVSLLTEGGATQSVQTVLAATHGYGWMHYVCTVTGGNVQWSYFTAGSDVETAIGSPSASHPYNANSKLHVGVGPIGSNYATEMQLGRVLVYNRALSAAEKLVNHKATRGDYV